MYKGDIKKFFPRPKRRREDTRGETGDIIKMILLEDTENGEDATKAAPLFRGSTVEETCHNIWKWIRKEVRYKKDPDGWEKVKGPAETVADGYGDCKSMSILASSILKNLGIDHAYRFAGYHKDKDVSHVYIWLPDYKICLDATYHTFNSEVPYKFKKDHMATKISRISGAPAYIGQASDIPMNEWADRGKEVPRARKIDYSGITDGELTALLMLEQLNIYKGFNQDVKRKELEQAYNLVENAFRHGLQNFSRSNLTGNFDPLASQVIKTLLKAKNKKKPAGAQLVSSSKSDSIGSLLIPKVDCNKFRDELMRWTRLEQTYLLPGSGVPAGMTYGDVAGKVSEARREYEKCLSQNSDIDILNEHLEGSAHHLLYIYAQNSGSPAAVVTKRVLHSGAVGGISDATKLSYENLKLWMRNGVLRRNAQGGAGLLTPEQTISAISQAESKGISDFGATAAIIVAVIAIVKGAADVVISILDKIERDKRNRIIASAQGIGTPQFGPEVSDWSGYNRQNLGGNNGGDGLFSGNTPLLIGGGLLALGALSK